MSPPSGGNSTAEAPPPPTPRRRRPRAARFGSVGAPGTRRRRDSAWAPTTRDPGRSTTGADKGGTAVRAARQRTNVAKTGLGLRARVRLHRLASRRECASAAPPAGGGAGSRASRRRGCVRAPRGPVRAQARDWSVPVYGGFSNFASRVAASRGGEPGGGGGGGGGYGGGGWDRDARAVRSWSDDRGDRGFDRGFDRGAGTVAGPREGGRWRQLRRKQAVRRRTRGFEAERPRRRWDDADAGGWNDRNGDDRFGRVLRRGWRGAGGKATRAESACSPPTRNTFA